MAIADMIVIVSFSADGNDTLKDVDYDNFAIGMLSYEKAVEIGRQGIIDVINSWVSNHMGHCVNEGNLDFYLKDKNDDSIVIVQNFNELDINETRDYAYWANNLAEF